VPAATKKSAKLDVIKDAKLGKLPWLIHGFSTRVGGVSKVYGKTALNLGFTKDDTRAAVEKNRAAFENAIGAADKKRKPWPMASLKQVHSDVIFRVGSPKDCEQPCTGDGLITNVPGLLLAVQTADCLPVLLVDPEHKAVGAFHAGWRGTFKRIVEKGVGAMQQHFGSDPKKMLASIGPGIHSCCYEVGSDLRAQFEAQFDYGKELFIEVSNHDPIREKYPMLFLTARAPGHSELGPQIHLDLVEANRRQLLGKGLLAKNVWASELCTSCRTDVLFSHRKERGRTGRMMGAVGIAPMQSSVVGRILRSVATKDPVEAD
jgi:polyphenol oxidase